MARRALDAIFPALLASAIAGALFPVQARHGFDLADEGFGLYDERQREMIRQMHANRVAWVMVFLPPVEGRVRLGFRNTHPLVWRHLREAYRRVEIPPFLPDNRWFRSQE